MIWKECVTPSLVVLMWMVFRTDSIFVLKEYKIHECDPPADCDYIVSIHQDPSTRNLFLATRNSVLKLDENLILKLDRRTDEGSYNGTNVLLALRDTDFILCKSDPNGICELREVVHLNLLDDVDSRTYVVPPGGQSRPVGWIDQGPLDGEDTFNIAVTSGGTRGGTIPLLSTRRLPKGDLSPIPEFLDFLVDDYSVPASYFKSGPCLEVDIEPFYGFSVGSYRYLLKRHSATQKGEYTGVKIVQLCRGNASYRSYIELPLECGNDLAEGNGESQVLVNSAAHLVNDYLYVSFTRNTGTESVESNICSYSITWINERFMERRRECLEARTETTELSWFGYDRCPSKPLPSSKFDYSRLGEDDSCYDLGVAQPLGGTKPIQQAPMGILTQPEVITSILVVKSPGDETTTYILGEGTGYIHMLDEYGSHESEPIDVGHQILSVGGLILHPEGDRFYASSQRKIVLISLAKPTTTAPSTTPSTTASGSGANSSLLNTMLGVAVIVGCIVLGVAVSWSRVSGYILQL